MEKLAFKLALKPGCAAEYKKRHDEIWPEMVALLKGAGISDYSIYLDEETEVLFAVLWRADDHKMAELPTHPVVRKWWLYMSDIIERGESTGPETKELKLMFHLA